MKAPGGADLRKRLTHQWNAIGPTVEVPGWPRRAAGVRVMLLDAYDQPSRRYHDLRHLDEVLARIRELTAPSPPVGGPVDAVLAAWFHDAIYTANHPPGADEEASAALAEQVLTSTGLPVPMVREVARLVRLTGRHEVSAGDATGAVLCDADLAVLARDPPGYAAYRTAIRAEYAHIPDEQFRAGRAAALRSLAGRDWVFSTVAGRAAWERTARANIQAELGDLAAAQPR